jgi:hypothetical protein
MARQVVARHDLGQGDDLALKGGGNLGGVVLHLQVDETGDAITQVFAAQPRPGSPRSHPSPPTSRTRRQHGDCDNETCSANSAMVWRASRCRANKMAWSVESKGFMRWFLPLINEIYKN